MPVASSATKLVLDDAAYKDIEKQLDLGQKSLDSLLKGGEKAGAWLGRSDTPTWNTAKPSRARRGVAATPILAEGERSGLRRLGAGAEQAAGVSVGPSAV